ncbi:MAG: DUF2796 domain-containing protein [Pseudomonadota bacterium]
MPHTVTRLAAALAFGAAVFAAPAFAGDDHKHDHDHDHNHSKEESRQLDAHVHGVSTLKVAQDGNKFAFELESPADDIVGFERKPKTDAEKAAVQKAVAMMGKPKDLFTPPAAAACEAMDVDAELHVHGDHAGFEAKWVYQCANASAMTGMTTTFFKNFPKAEEIDVEAVLAGGAMAAELTASSPTVTFGQ